MTWCVGKAADGPSAPAGGLQGGGRARRPVPPPRAQRIGGGPSTDELGINASILASVDNIAIDLDDDSVLFGSEVDDEEKI